MGNDLAEAAALLGRLLAAVEDGTLEAKGVKGQRLLGRIEGAQVAFQAASEGGDSGS